MKRIYLVILAALLICTNLHAQSASQLFQEGRDSFSDKLFSRSIESFKEFIQQYPSDPRVDQADYMIGVSLFYQRKFTNTISHFQRYEENYPGSAYNRRIHYWKGLSYYGQQNYRSAIGELNKQSQIIEEIYFRQKSLQLLGYSYEKTDQFEKAGESYKELFESDPGKELSALALERQGYIQLKLKNYEDALDFFDTVTVEYSGVAQVQKEIPFYQGECYYQLEDYDNSLKKFETFLTLYSNSVNREKAVFRMGTLYAGLNNQDSAKEYMSLLTDEYPDSAYIMDAHIILAESYMSDGNMKEARKSLSKLLENEKDPVEIQKLQFNMARTYEDDADESLKWYILASRGLDPDISSESLYRSAVLYDSRGEAARAVLLFERLFNQYKSSPYREEVGDWIVLYYEDNEQDLALKNHLDRMLNEYENSEKRTLYLYMRGNISYRDGKHNEALRYYQNIINVERDDILILNETRYRIAYIYTVRKEFYRAADYFKEVLTSQSRDELYYRSLLSLGICYLNVKDNDQAEPRFKELAEADPPTLWTGDAFFYLGKIQMDRGHYKEATSYYKLAAENSEDTERKVQSLYQLGWSLMRTASFKEASDAFDKLYSIAPEHSLAGDSLYRSGTALSYLELWTESLERFTKALELIEYFTLREELLYQTAWSHFMLMNFDDALSYLKQLEKEFPTSPLPADGLFRAAEALTEKGETEAAVDAYISLYNEFTSSPLSETALYRALSLSMDNSEKLALMKEFLSLYSGNDRAFQTALQAASILQEGNLKENEKTLSSEILSLDLDGRERAVILLGQYYPLLKEKETLQKLNKLSALENLTNSEQEKINLYKGIWNYWAGNSLEAASAFDSIMSADISVYSAEAQYYTAKMLGDLKEWKKAGDAFLRIRYRYPDQQAWVERAVYDAALAYKKAGDLASYNRTAAMLKETFPDSELNVKLSEEAASAIEESPEEGGMNGIDELETLSPSVDILPLMEEE
ncbi:MULTISPECIES: tetratricopeptide repeat protein [unclassified Oceanispirochaeta]|uniref:tetratricopeptide repeat protein n=1 Tax=unclassified Oceanispirochaeta TaxID=2635722 RepID=UPI000E08E8A4|nr:MULTISPECIES: tetratricopeptide repeat protein [unclassified Oceanispirochaeta]MBF9015660.1 tetratricopeptide repeat protein [Oceanispirochaeta sp. M2]NPD73434.1 tetratricopeptide repeat protein [Oceanispirochaeta sp. M1]RDG30907.1 outer membrane protein assembly factor BamD [Oceanispirochaeta sp. M1]